MDGWGDLGGLGGLGYGGEAESGEDVSLHDRRKTPSRDAKPAAGALPAVNGKHASLKQPYIHAQQPSDEEDNELFKTRAVCKLKDFLPESTEPEVILRLLREHNYDVWAAAQAWAYAESNARRREDEEMAWQMQMQEDAEMRQGLQAGEAHLGFSASPEDMDGMDQQGDSPRWSQMTGGAGLSSSMISQKSDMTDGTSLQIYNLMEWFEDKSQEELQRYLTDNGDSLEDAINAITADTEEEELLSSPVRQLQSVLIGWQPAALQGLLEDCHGSVEKAVNSGINVEHDVQAAEFLMSMFPDVLPKRVQTILKRNEKCAPEERLKRATEDLLLMFSSGLGDDEDQGEALFAQDLAKAELLRRGKLEQLKTMFCDTHSAETVEAVFGLTNFRYADAVDLLKDMQSQNEPTEQDGFSGADEFHADPAASLPSWASEDEMHEVRNKKRERKELKRWAAMAQDGVALQRPASPVPAQTGQRSASPRMQTASTRKAFELRMLAHEQYQRRTRYFEDANLAYNRGDGAEAKRLANLGKSANEEMRKLNTEAKHKIFVEKNAQISRDNLREIDLHGLTVNEALDVLANHIQVAKEVANSSNGHYPVRIITGAGIHSIGGKPRIKPAVVDWLKNQGYRINVGHGQVDVVVGG